MGDEDICEAFVGVEILNLVSKSCCLSGGEKRIDKNGFMSRRYER